MIGYVIGLVLLAYITMVIFTKFHWTAANYEGKQIPYSLGTFILISYLGFQILFVEQVYFFAFFSYSIGIWFTGLIDDWFGTKEQKGLKGHLKAFVFHGTISTGIIKIIATIIFSIYFLIFLQPLEIDDWFRYGIILILTPHIMNLFDTRPLRVWKISLMYSSLFLSILQYFPFSAYLYILTFLFIFYVFEGHKIAMLGDNGATLVGALLAVMTILHATVIQQWVLIGLFFLLTIIAEKTSISKIIEKYGVLKWLDQLGVHSQK